MLWTWRPVGASCRHQSGEPPYVLLVTLVFPVSGGSGLERLRLLFKVGAVGQLACKLVSCNVAQQLSSH
jgi:hypothetical protein